MSITSINNKLQKSINDKRYIINYEFCGEPTFCLVARFDGEFLGSCKFDNVNDTILLCIVHQGTRLNIL